MSCFKKGSLKGKLDLFHSKRIGISFRPKGIRLLITTNISHQFNRITLSIELTIYHRQYCGKYQIIKFRTQTHRKLLTLIVPIYGYLINEHFFLFHEKPARGRVHTPLHQVSSKTCKKYITF